MKFPFWLSYFLIAAFLCVEAKATQPPSVPAQPVELPPEKPPAKPEQTKALELKGTLEKLNAKESTFTVEGKDFVFAKGGKVFIDGSLKKLSDLHEGDLLIIVYFSKTESNTATRINKNSSS